MAYSPISAVPIQYSKADGTPANGYYIKFYLANSVTPISMQTDSGGATSIAKAKLNESGYPISNPNDENTVFIPHLSTTYTNYRFVLYASAADADANNVTSGLPNIQSVEINAAATLADDLRADLAASSGSSLVGFLQGGTGAVPRTLQAKGREEVSIMDFGADSTGASDSTAALNLAKTYLGGYGTIKFPSGTFKFNADFGSAKINLKGEGIGKTVITYYSNSLPAITYGSNTSWDYVLIEDMTIRGDSGYFIGTGVQFGHDPYISNDEFAGRTIFNRVKFVELDKAISRLYGNIGVYLTNCVFSYSNFHIWTSGPSPLMHGGCLFAKLCHFDTAQKAVFYLDSDQIGSGQFITEDCIIEANPGFVVFIKNFNNKGIGEGFIIRASWNEGNASAGSVTIDSVSYTPRHIYAKNCGHLRAEDTTMGSVELVSSNFTTNNCQLDFMTLTLDSNSTCFHENAIYDSGKSAVGKVKSIRCMARTAGNFASAAPILHKRHTAKVSPAVLLYQNQFGSTVNFTGTASRNTTSATEGVLFSQTSVEDLVINNGENLLPSGGTFTVTANKYYAWHFTYRIVSGTSAFFSISYNTTIVSGVEIKSSTWETIGGIADTIGAAGLPTTSALYLSGGASSATVRMAAFAVVEFSTRQDAIDFLNDKVHPV